MIAAEWRGAQVRNDEKISGLRRTTHLVVRAETADEAK